MCACPGSDEPDGEQKGLFSLPFMKRALEKRKLEAQQEAQEVRLQLPDHLIIEWHAVSWQTVLPLGRDKDTVVGRQMLA